MFCDMMGCGTAHFGRRGLETTQTDKIWSKILFLGVSTRGAKHEILQKKKRLWTIPSKSFQNTAIVWQLCRVVPSNCFRMLGEGVWVRAALWSSLSLAFLSRLNFLSSFQFINKFSLSKGSFLTFYTQGKPSSPWRRSFLPHRWAVGGAITITITPFFLLKP